RRGSKSGNETEKGCSCESRAAAEVEHRQVTISRARGSAGTAASVARLQQLQVLQSFVEKDQEQRQSELQGPQPGPGDPLCRSRLPAKTSFCQAGWILSSASSGSPLVCWEAQWRQPLYQLHTDLTQTPNKGFGGNPS
ncbi:hypothetical protein EK904_008522, partial [Melospiza melodia maxima]